MGKNEQVEHEGIIKEISEVTVKIGFVAQPACSGCYAKGVCSVEEKNGETIEVPVISPGLFKTGEKVKITINESLGLKAVWIAYVLPFLLVMVSLFVLVPLLKSELKGGLISLAVLIPYYLIIYLNRGRIKKEIKFTIVQCQ